MRLGVYPAAAPTLTGVFTQRFEALFRRVGALGCAVCFAPRHSSWFIYARMWGRWVLPAALPTPFSATLSPALSVYLCANVGPQGATRHSESSPLSLSARMWGFRVCQWSDCLPHSSHTPPVLVLPRQRESSLPWCPSLPLLLVWMNVYSLFPWCRTSLPFDFLSVLVV